MAKVLGTFGTNLKGSLGNVTFRVTKNGNIASQKASQVTNPKTESQMAQRCKMNTVVQAYSILKSIVDHSWEGVVYGSKSMNYFQKINLQRLIATGRNTAFLAKDNKIVAPFDFQISKGSLGQIDNRFDAKGFNLGADCTVAQLVEYFGAQLGDQITFLQITLQTSNGGIKTASGTQQNACVFHKARITLSTDAEATAKVFTTAGTFNSEAFSKIEVDGTLNWDSANGYMNLQTTSSIMMGAVILSRKSGTSWQRSESYLGVVGNLAAFGAAAAIDTYDPTSPYYLNNAATTSSSLSAETYVVTLKDYEGNSPLSKVAINYDQASAGTVVVVTPNSGYKITGADVSSNPSDTSKDVDFDLENGVLSFTMPAYDVLAQIEIEESVSYNVTTSGSGAGMVSVDPTSNVEKGATVTITKPSGITLSGDITVATASGTTVTLTTAGSWTSSAKNTGTFVMPAENVVVTVPSGGSEATGE